jgi:3',5'-cyclic AMP phosphodiesterase CpdA
MKDIKIPPYIRSSNPALARWQSAVAQVARENIQKENPNLSQEEVNQAVFNHPMVLGTNILVSGNQQGNKKLNKKDVEEHLPTQPSKLNLHPLVHAYLSQEVFNKLQVNPLLETIIKDIDSNINTSLAGFPDSDYAYSQWVNAAKNWFSDAPPDHSTPYVNISAHGGASSNFGVYTIPENSKLLILGDFGTGLNDATALLITALKQVKPDIIIHLGDIYYSGTQDECNQFVTTFDTAFKTVFGTTSGKATKTLPVFSLPGNHEYYSGGAGFFKSVITMNKNNGFSDLDQQASFFSLRTKQNNWQFLGMDTGYNSVSTIIHNYAPWLEFNEAAWHQNKLENFDGQTILLSHHQFFSAHEEINGTAGVSYQSGTDQSKLTYLNGNLEAVFKPYLPKVAAWFWGHEHILNIFASNQQGLAKGRLIGNSGYEEWSGQNPYASTGSTYKGVTPAVEVGTTSVVWNKKNYDFLNHGFAVVSLDGADADIDYYEYPVFTPNTSMPDPLPSATQLKFSDTIKTQATT